MDTLDTYDSLGKFSQEQGSFIKTCLAQGKPWSLFAENVVKQGWCSSRQEQTLKKMVHRIDKINCRRELQQRNFPNSCYAEWDYINDEWQPDYH